MDQTTLKEFDDAVKEAESSVDLFLALCKEMEDFYEYHDPKEIAESKKWAHDAVKAIGSQLGDRDTREIAIGYLIESLHEVGTFMLRECANEAMFEKLQTEMV